MIDHPRFTGLIALAALVVLPAGCGVPSSGSATSVEEAPGLGAQGNSPDTPAEDPSDDAVETVENFLSAAAGDPITRDQRLSPFLGDEVTELAPPETDLSIVHLTEDPAESDDGNLTSTTVTVTGTIIGVYDQQGQVNRALGGASYEGEFQLDRPSVNANWTITASPLDVVATTDLDFEASFNHAPVYFPDSDASMLVPDIRWIASDLLPEERYERLIGWLMEGPSARVRPVVASHFKNDTTLRSVGVSGSKVSVDLSSESATNDRGWLEVMGAQLAWTLGLHGGETLELGFDDQPRLSEPVSRWDGWSKVPTTGDESSYFVDGETIVGVVDNEVVRESDSSVPLVGTELDGLAEVTVAPDSPPRVVAVADPADDPARLYMDVGEQTALEPVPGFTAGELEDPQWLDAQAVLVLADERLTVVDINGETFRLNTSQDDGEAPITALAVAPDARRIAYVSEGVAKVAPLQRTDDGTYQLGGSERVGLDIDNVRDIGWSQENFLMMIGDHASGNWLWEVSIDSAVATPLDGADAGENVASHLAVRCGDPRGRSDQYGQPVMLEIDGTIYRVHNDRPRPLAEEQQPVAGSYPFLPN